jgi:hypothetical protein
MTPLVQLKKRFSPFGFVTPRALVSLVCAAAGFIVTGTLLAFFRPEVAAKVSNRTVTFAERVAHQRADDFRALPCSLKRLMKTYCPTGGLR